MSKHRVRVAPDAKARGDRRTRARLTCAGLSVDYPLVPDRESVIAVSDVGAAEDDAAYATAPDRSARTMVPDSSIGRASGC